MMEFKLAENKPTDPPPLGGYGVASVGVLHDGRSGTSFGEESIGMFVARGATAEENQRFAARIPEFVFFAGGNGDGITGADVCQFAFNAHASEALDDEIDFFGFGVVMLLGARANGEARFGEALIPDG